MKSRIKRLRTQTRVEFSMTPICRKPRLSQGCSQFATAVQDLGRTGAHLRRTCLNLWRRKVNRKKGKPFRKMEYRSSTCNSNSTPSQRMPRTPLPSTPWSAKLTLTRQCREKLSLKVRSKVTSEHCATKVNKPSVSTTKGRPRANRGLVCRLTKSITPSTPP